MRYFILLLSFLITFSACSRKPKKKFKFTEKFAEKLIKSRTGENIDIDISEDGINIKSDQGNISITGNDDSANIYIESEEGSISFSSGRSAKIPDEFPKDIYIYKRSIVESAAATAHGQMVILKSDDTISTIRDVYLKKMPASGWTNQGTFDNYNQTQMLFKQDDRKTIVLLYSVDGKAAIHLSHTIEK